MSTSSSWDPVWDVGTRCETMTSRFLKHDMGAGRTLERSEVGQEFLAGHKPSHNFLYTVDLGVG